LEGSGGGRGGGIERGEEQEGGSQVRAEREGEYKEQRSRERERQRERRRIESSSPTSRRRRISSPHQVTVPTLLPARPGKEVNRFFSSFFSYTIIIIIYILSQHPCERTNNINFIQIYLRLSIFVVVNCPISGIDSG